MPGQSVRIAIDKIDCRFSFCFVIGRHFVVIAAVSGGGFGGGGYCVLTMSSPLMRTGLAPLRLHDQAKNLTFLPCLETWRRFLRVTLPD